MRRTFSIIVTLGVSIGLVLIVAPAFGASADESGFLSRTNEERTSRGIKAVVLDAHLSDIARRHSQEMASRNDLYHNDNLGNEVDGWEELDENVGVGRTVDDIHNAFMDSAVHRSGILGNYGKVGIGTAWKDGQLWVTEVFFRAKRTSTTTTTTRRATTVRRATVRTATPPRRVPVVRTAAAPKPVPVAPVAPALPAYSSGKIEKLLGDLAFAGASQAAESGEGATPAAETKLASVLWQFVEIKSS